MQICRNELLKCINTEMQKIGNAEMHICIYGLSHIAHCVSLMHFVYYLLFGLYVLHIAFLFASCLHIQLLVSILQKHVFIKFLVYTVNLTICETFPFENKLHNLSIRFRGWCSCATIMH